MSRPDKVRLVEVGPRDGLQNEAGMVSTPIKLRLIGMLVDAGLRHIEVGAFVSPRWIPQMADSAELVRALPHRDGVHYPVLTPNLKGFEDAVAAGAREVAVFASASEAFSQKNINCSIAESLARFEPVMRAAMAGGIAVRGYVSCVLGCPYLGEVAPQAVLTVTERLFELGCYEVSLGDTLGTGTAGSTSRLLDHVLARCAAERIAGHFHDTWGQALANILTALDFGVACFDSSVAGLGGCPYAPGASGNVATEDVLRMLDGIGIETGVDFDALIDAAAFISAELGRPPASRAARAALARRMRQGAA